MLAKNLDVSKGLVNGARGVVTKFMSDLGGKKNFDIIPSFFFFNLVIVSCKFDRLLVSGESIIS